MDLQEELAVLREDVKMLAHAAQVVATKLETATAEETREDAGMVAKAAATVAGKVEVLAQAASEFEKGAEIGLTDADGQALHAGDRVRVVRSDRFGEGEGEVLRAIGGRVNVRMDNGTDGDKYTASTGRVTRLTVAA